MNIPAINIASIEADAFRANSRCSAFSDTSSDLSDMTASVPSVNSGSMSTLPVEAILTSDEISQVEMFYRSHKTDVRVCQSLANLYISAPKTHGLTNIPQTPEKNNKKGSTKDKTKLSPSRVPEMTSNSPDPSVFSKDEWEFSKTGIPVLVLDTGDHLRERHLRIVLAEKGSGFTLWQEHVNHLTNYRTPHTNFHTINLQKDSTRLAGLSFDDGKSAVEFAEAVKGFTDNPNDDLFNLSKKKKSKKDKKKSKKEVFKSPKKVDISQPCCFVHVTKLERPDVGGDFPPPPSE